MYSITRSNYTNSVLNTLVENINYLMFSFKKARKYDHRESLSGELHIKDEMSIYFKAKKILKKISG
jgi:hypothetical protein